MLILEDNPYGDLRYTGEDIPCIKTLDTDGRVIYSGSFSKILSPGIRVAFTIANKNLIAKMTVGKQASDVHTPEKYGIYQSVGDTSGPGGIIRALRTLPMIEHIAKSIEKYCPNAWVINYTNPMTVIVRTLYKVFPAIKAFGCCHEVFGTQMFLAKIMTEKRI